MRVIFLFCIFKSLVFYLNSLDDNHTELNWYGLPAAIEKYAPKASPKSSAVIPDVLKSLQITADTPVVEKKVKKAKLTG